MKEFSDYGDLVQNSTIKGFVRFAMSSEEFMCRCRKNSCFEERKLVFRYTQYKLLFDIILVYKKKFLHTWGEL